MKRLILSLYFLLFLYSAHAQMEPIVIVDNITVAHEHRGWRVIDAATTPVHYSLSKGDLIVRIDKKNAAETGPMQVASLLNEGYRRKIDLFIERGGFRMETGLREIRGEDLEPVGANPFRHVASGFSAPDAEFNDIGGQPLSLDRFKGKWLLIDFMATWCPPCIEAMPKVLNVADRNHLSLLMVAMNDKTEAVRRMQQRYDITSPIAMMQAMSPLPIDFGITTNRWTGQVPALVLIRPNGEIALIEIGGFDANHFEKTIERTIDCLMSCKAEDVLK